MNTNIIYCRLCAEPKQSYQQIDLQTNSEKRWEVVEKLTRINAPTEFIDTKLPSTVCLDCLQAINKCFDFVSNIEYAQNTLTELLSKHNVKKEYQSDDEVSLGKVEHERFEGELPFDCESTSICIKIESIKDTPGDTVKVKSPSTPGKAKKIKKSVSLDSIPLSRLKQSWEHFHWLCTFCQTHFKNIEELQIHSMAVHNICNPYRCSDCKVRKQSLDQFLIHVQRHNKNLKYSCYKCFKKFRTLSGTQKHRRTHVDTELNCPGCNTTFKSKEELKYHKDTFLMFKAKNKIEIPPVSFDGQTCLICLKTFKKKGNVKLHILRMHSEKHQDHVCEVCGKSFYDKHNHATHMLHVHTDYRPHKCQICKLGFKTTKSLKDHVGRHYNEKPLACDKCGKSFRLQKHLKKHSIIHTDLLPFQCSYCDKRFQRKQYLTNHLMQHTGERPYSCEPCQLHFTSWGNYNKHMICRHNHDTARKKAVLVDEL